MKKERKIYNVYGKYINSACKKHNSNDHKIKHFKCMQDQI